eukprot:gene9732-9890_t
MSDQERSEVEHKQEENHQETQEKPEDPKPDIVEAAGNAQQDDRPAEMTAADEEGKDVGKETERELDPSREHARDRSRDRSRERRKDKDRDADRDFRARSRSRSRDRRRKGHRGRRSRFEEDSDSDREDHRKKAAASAAPGGSTYPGPPSNTAAPDPYAALRASNPALSGLDSNAANMLLRQQMILQQQMLLQQQAALQAQQVMSKAMKTQNQSTTQRLSEKQLKAQRELFVGNLAPGTVTEQSLYQVFHSALVAAFPQASQPGQEPVLKVNITGRFAFVEFRLAEYATAALQLNGQIALMGNTLKIARPSSYVEPTQVGPTSGNLGGFGGMPGVMGAAGLAAPGPLAVGGLVPAAGCAAPDPLATLIPTPFLCVTGMVTMDVLASDEEYKEECSKYGSVVDIKVPRPPPGTAAQLMGTDYFGKAFVHFADVPSAQKAKEAIHGRMFAGNVVQAMHITLPTYQLVPANLAV